jgi:hypothetical protein
MCAVCRSLRNIYTNLAAGHKLSGRQICLCAVITTGRLVQVSDRLNGASPLVVQAIVYAALPASLSAVPDDTLQRTIQYEYSMGQQDFCPML